MLHQCYYVLVHLGMCLLQLVLDGYLDPFECYVRYATCMVLSAASIVIGMFLFGLTFTQSIMNDILLDDSS